MRRFFHSILVCALVLGFTAAVAGATDSAPQFPAPVYWVAKWNAPGYFLYRGEPEWDGVAYDAHITYGRSARDGKVPFRMPCSYNCNEPLLTDNVDLDAEGVSILDYRFPEERFFREDDTTTDPRLTPWWQAFMGDDFGSLWEAIERSAVSRDHPVVTRAILEDMVAKGIVCEDEITAMTKERVRWAMFAYTYLAIREHLARQWNLAAQKPFGSLWATVEAGLGSKTVPGMTNSTLRDMEHAGVISGEQRKGWVAMRPDEIAAAMRAFVPTLQSQEFKFM